jgi:hypothetical protein
LNNARDWRRIRLSEAMEKPMTTVAVDEIKLKRLLKSAIVEVLEERQDLVREAVAEALEEGGLRRAIHEGMRTPTTSRATVFQILKRAK